MSSTEAAGARRPRLSWAFLSRSDLIVAALLVVAAALAWWWLIDTAHAPMSMSQPAPFSGQYLAAGFMMWAVMMLAMMLPAAAPMILLFDRVSRGRSGAAISHTLVFVGAYVLVWLIFSAAAIVLQAALVHQRAIAPMSLALNGRSAAAGLLFATAVYELTSAKRACLNRCQSPLLFIARHWRPNAAGALRMGLEHGLFCLGCCWAMMLLLFVGGVMNLAWVALLGFLVLGQKLMRPAWHAERFVATALFAGAIALLLT